MRLREDKSGFDYICTHVDDFKVVAYDAKMWMDKISNTLFLKEQGPRSYYLGNDYTYHDGQDIWTYGAKTYCRDAVARVEREFGCLAYEKTPYPVEDPHPELDTSPLLNVDDHRKYKMLLGML